jgi:hypothetical protein
MRELSKFEQDIVKKICVDVRDIGGLLNDFLKGIVVEIDRDNNQITLKIEVPAEAVNTNSTYVRERANYLTKKIVIIVNLLNYLTREGYLLTYFPAHGRSIKGHFVHKGDIEDFNKNPEKYSTHWQFTDEDVKIMLFNYLDISFITTETLIDLAKKNFKTQEQIRHSQNLKATWCGISIAFMIGVSGLLLTWNSNKDKFIQFDAKQFEIIQSKLNNISTHIDTLNKTLKQNKSDTTNMTKKK